MFTATPSTADFWFLLSNLALILGAIIVAVATISSFIFSGAREHFANERIAVNEAETARANESAALADERAAEATLKANETDLARVRLEERLAARHLTKGQIKAISEAMKPWSALASGTRQSVAVFAFPPSFESSSLTEQILTALGNAGWSLNRYPVTYGLPVTAVLGIGILVPMSNNRAHKVADALSTALLAEGLAASVMEIKRPGCEEIAGLQDRAETDPACSSISVFVGNHPSLAAEATAMANSTPSAPPCPRQ